MQFPTEYYIKITFPKKFKWKSDKNDRDFDNVCYSFIIIISIERTSYLRVYGIPNFNSYKKITTIPTKCEIKKKDLFVLRRRL